MTQAHTPGPWQVNFTDKRQVCDADGEMRGCSPIAHCVGAEAKANARLIAAAPQLLEALEQMLLGERNEYLTLQGQRNLARAAIRAAKGE